MNEAVDERENLKMETMAEEEMLIREFRSALEEDTAVPVAAIQVLLGVIRRTEASTMHGLDEELRWARDVLVRYSDDEGSSSSKSLGGRTSMSVMSGCELFLRHATRTFLEFPDFDACKAQLLRRGSLFAQKSGSSRDRIAALGAPFIRDGSVVMVHGRSRVVVALLARAIQRGTHFTVIATDAGGAGDALRRDLQVPVTIIHDAAIGYFTERITLVLVGAEAVVENGGVVNKIGTLVVATIAKAYHIPVYVAAESFKFGRLFPLKQRDLRPGAPSTLTTTTTTTTTATNNDFVPESSGSHHLLHPPVDYTPPAYIDLLFTDLGVLTPAAVSDELIRLYQ